VNRGAFGHLTNPLDPDTDRDGLRDGSLLEFAPTTAWWFVVGPLAALVLGIVSFTAWGVHVKAQNRLALSAGQKIIEDTVPDLVFGSGGKVSENDLSTWIHSKMGRSHHKAFMNIGRSQLLFLGGEFDPDDETLFVFQSVVELARDKSEIVAGLINLAKEKWGFIPKDRLEQIFGPYQIVDSGPSQGKTWVEQFQEKLVEEGSLREAPEGYYYPPTLELFTKKPFATSTPLAEAESPTVVAS
jgi:hypothetical protein